LPDNPPSIHLVEYAWSAAATAHTPLGTEHTHIIPVKASLPLWWQLSNHQKTPQSLVFLIIQQSWGHVCWKKVLYVCTCLFFYSCVFNCQYSCQLYLSAFYAVESSTSQMQTKQQSALKIGKKLEGVKTASWVEVSLYF
jgi:hypothetical protein